MCLFDKWEGMERLHNLHNYMVAMAAKVSEEPPRRAGDHRGRGRRSHPALP